MRHHERRLFRLLPVACLVATGAGAWAEPQQVAPSAHDGRLRAAMKAALRQEDWDRAIEAGLALDALTPDDFVPAYGLARAYARKGESALALEWLQKSADRHYFDVSELINEADFDGIREQPAFKSVLDKVRKNSVDELERFRPLAEKATILTRLPPGYDKAKPAPLLVVLHGLGGDAESTLGIWKQAAEQAGAILVAPQSPYKIADYGFDWLVIEHAEYLVLSAIEKAKAEHAVDSKRIAVAGYSQGGVMAFAIALRNPTVFAGAIPVAAYWDRRYTPIPEAPTLLPRFAILNGAGDSAAENNREAARRLEAIRVPVHLRIYEGLGHSYPRKDREAELAQAVSFALGG